MIRLIDINDYKYNGNNKKCSRKKATIAKMIK